MGVAPVSNFEPAASDVHQRDKRETPAPGNSALPALTCNNGFANLRVSVP
jgi:hypothetical protein